MSRSPDCKMENIISSGQCLYPQKCFGKLWDLKYVLVERSISFGDFHPLTSPNSLLFKEIRCWIMFWNKQNSRYCLWNTLSRIALKRWSLIDWKKSCIVLYKKINIYFLSLETQSFTVRPRTFQFAIQIIFFTHLIGRWILCPPGSIDFTLYVNMKNTTIITLRHNYHEAVLSFVWQYIWTCLFYNTNGFSGNMILH